MEDTQSILAKFIPISLERMKEVTLLDRIDKKFIFNAEMLGDILEKLATDYYALEINGLRTARYETVYFDTPSYEMYTKHHNGKLNRHKVRFRTYLDSEKSFFEIKFKNNKGRTLKTRVKNEVNNYTITGNLQLLLNEKTSYKVSELERVLRVFYYRITLINKNLTERITIDFGLEYEHKGEFFHFPNLVIAEVKQDKSADSIFKDLMLEKRIKPLSLSKYCLGIAKTVKEVKTNNLKPKIRYVNQIISKHAS